MELQISSLETKIEKMQEIFNKDLEEIKKSQLKMNNAIREIKNTLEGTNSRITEAEDRISEVEDKMVEIEDGRGIGRGDHFLSYKFIERTIERWTKFTKQVLIASSRHQVPRKSAHCLRREVGQKY